METKGGPKICSVNGCGRKHYGKGFCRQHYFRWLHEGEGSLLDRPFMPTKFLPGHKKVGGRKVGTPHKTKAIIEAVINGISQETETEMANPRGFPRFLPGHAKVGGKKKGTPNKTPAEIKAACLAVTPRMVKELERLALQSRMDAVRVAAIRELMDRGLGKPSQAHVVEGGVKHTFQVITHAQLFEGDSDPVLIPPISLNGFAESDADEAVDHE